MREERVDPSERRHQNMILAVVLSAIVLLGWGLLTETYFPTANPPVDQDREGPARCRSPQPDADPGRGYAAARCATAAIVLAETPARRDRDAAPRRLDQPQGRADRRSRPHHRARGHRPPIRRRSACSRRPARPAPIIGEFGWIGEGVALPGPDTVWQASGTALTPGDAGHVELEQRPGPDLPDPALGRRRLSVHRRADG